MGRRTSRRPGAHRHRGGSVRVAVVLVLLAAIVLVRSLIDFLDSPAGYPQTLISAVDGVLVVIILIDILRTVLTHLVGWGFPFRPFLVIGIIAAVREILAVSTRLTLTPGGTSPQVVTQSLFQLGTSAGVVLALAVALHHQGRACRERRLSRPRRLAVAP